MNEMMHRLRTVAIEHLTCRIALAWEWISPFNAHEHGRLFRVPALAMPHAGFGR